MSHFIHRCTCGAVIAECRCPDFNNNKHVTTVDRGCSRCHETKPLPKIALDPKSATWKITDCNGDTINLCKEEWDMVNKTINQHYYGED